MGSLTDGLKLTFADSPSLHQSFPSAGVCECAVCRQLIRSNVRQRMREEAKQMARPLAVLNGYLGPVIMSNANCAQQQHRSKCQKPSSPFEKFVKIVAAVGS